MKYCPECGAEYDDAFVACPKCREMLSDIDPERSRTPQVVHRVPDAAAGSLLCGMLQHHGLHAILRSATLPAYGVVRRDWGTTAWGEILVPAEEAEEAQRRITEYLEALERGGRVTDEDVEGGTDTE